MNKLAIYSSVVFMTILCTFCAGCISETNEGSIVNPSTVDSDAQKLFDYYVEIYNTKPSNYEIMMGD